MYAGGPAALPGADEVVCRSDVNGDECESRIKLSAGLQHMLGPSASCERMLVRQAGTLKMGGELLCERAGYNRLQEIPYH